ncbi:MAG: ornithine cyclodeaminase [Pseudomonadota bacterium]
MTQAPLYISETAVAGKLRWDAVVAALRAGHKLARAEIKDAMVGGGDRSFLNRAAWIAGLGGGVKSVTVFPENPYREEKLPTVQGVFLFFDDKTGALKAIIDGPLITKWKTAADSILGAQFLARKDVSKVLVIGAGALASALIEAYAHAMPQVDEIVVWARNEQKAQAAVKAAAIGNVKVVSVGGSLESYVRATDIIVTATSSSTPVLNGDWVRPGSHVDLVGAFRADTREADDKLIVKAKIFVDSRDTTIDHIGDLVIPIATGVIQRANVLGDFYDLESGADGRRSQDEITVFKNGGGAHLDLMTAKVIYDAVTS